VPKFHGRREAYTEIGIRRLKCTRCGARADFQWSACANNNYHLPVCRGCDIELNKLTLEFMNIPNAAELLDSYRRKYEQ
jgi:hypothetical protein